MKTPTAPTQYENNPFFVATKGFELLFNNAKTVGIFFAILAGLSTLGSIPSLFMQPNNQSANNTPTQPESIPHIPVEVIVIAVVIGLIVLAIFAFIGVILKGVGDYSSARIAKGETTGLNEALRAVFDNFWGYTWVIFLTGLKTFLWSLLFIIPGIIMHFRYSLAGVAYFDKKLKGNASIKESLALTKNAWFTTFGSNMLLDMITLGAVTALLMPGTNAILYRQFSLVPKGEKKPKPHFLSILSLILPIVLFGLIFALSTILLYTALNFQNVQPAPQEFI